MVAAHNCGTRAGKVLTSGIRQKDFPEGPEGLRSVPIPRGLPLFLGCLALAYVEVPLCEIGSIANLLISVCGSLHARHGPMFDSDIGVRIHWMLNNRPGRS